jgi:hypothetical protein
MNAPLLGTLVLLLFSGPLASGQGSDDSCEAPEITSHPIGAAICVGGSHVMSVDAAGTPPFTYQWFRDGLEITETSQTLIIGPVSIFDAGEYHVVVSNDCGEATSDLAVLSVSEGPEIATQPVGATLCPGESHELSVAATGTPPLNFEWFHDAVLVATGQTLTIDSATAADAGTYQVSVSNGCGFVFSNPVFLTVFDEPEITGQPTGADICTGGSHVMSVDAAGTPPFTYQWFRDGQIGRAHV